MASVYFRGDSLRIDVTDDGRSSIQALYEQYRGDRNIFAALARADRLIHRLAQMGRLKSGEEFRQETQGYWAIRAIPIRVYGWYTVGKVFVLSHAICKRRDRLDQADVDRMNRNRASYVTPGGT